MRYSSLPYHLQMNKTGSLVIVIGCIKVDRIAIIVSYNGTLKFLGAPNVTPSTGKNIVDVVYDRLVQWNIVGQVNGLS